MSYGSIDGSGFGSRNPFGGPSRQGYQPLGKVLIPSCNVFYLAPWGTVVLLAHVQCGWCTNITLAPRVSSATEFQRWKPNFCWVQFAWYLHDEAPHLNALRTSGCNVKEQRSWGLWRCFGGLCSMFSRPAHDFPHLPITFARSLSKWLLCSLQTMGVDEKMWKGKHRG